ncbi:hypothetical protein Efla_005631 [Eimeria flavescens]
MQRPQQPSLPIAQQQQQQHQLQQLHQLQQQQQQQQHVSSSDEDDASSLSASSNGSSGPGGSEDESRTSSRPSRLHVGGSTTLVSDALGPPAPGAGGRTVAAAAGVSMLPSFLSSVRLLTKMCLILEDDNVIVCKPDAPAAKKLGKFMVRYDRLVSRLETLAARRGPAASATVPGGLLKALDDDADPWEWIEDCVLTPYRRENDRARGLLHALGSYQASILHVLRWGHLEAPLPPLHSLRPQQQQQQQQQQEQQRQLLLHSDHSLQQQAAAAFHAGLQERAADSSQQPPPLQQQQQTLTQQEGPLPQRL